MVRFLILLAGLCGLTAAVAAFLLGVSFASGALTDYPYLQEIYEWTGLLGRRKEYSALDVTMSEKRETSILDSPQKFGFHIWPRTHESCYPSSLVLSWSATDLVCFKLRR